MLSFSFLDVFFEKLLPVKGKEASLSKFSTSQNLMGNGNFYQSLIHECRRDLIDGNFIVPEYLEMQTTNDNAVMNNVFPWLIGNNVSRHIPKYPFSPHVSTIIQSSLRFVLHQSEMLECINYLNFIPNILYESSFVTPAFKNIRSKECIYSANKSLSTSLSKLTDTSHLSKDKGKQNCEIYKFNSSICIDNKSAMSEKNNILSLELANKKAKELHKRSKKRRRRQKKADHVVGKSDHQTCIDNHSLQTESTNEHGPFSNVSLEGARNNSIVTSIKNPSRIESNANVDYVLDIVNMKGSSTNVVEVVFPSVSSFVISVVNTSDEDSDWDTSSDSVCLPETNEFELSGLFVTNLSKPNDYHYSENSTLPQCSIFAFSRDDLDELEELQAALFQVNKNWEEATKEINSEPKLPSKVSFAPEDKLVEVRPVETYNRKGEWEIYASERLRFKRRIKELEKVLSPCFSEAHRLKTYLQLHQSDL